MTRKITKENVPTTTIYISEKRCEQDIVEGDKQSFKAGSEGAVSEVQAGFRDERVVRDDILNLKTIVDM